MRLPQPHYGESVRDDQICRVENFRELRIMLGLHHAVHVRHSDEVALIPQRNPFLHLGDDLGDLDRMYADAEKVVRRKGVIVAREN